MDTSTHTMGKLFEQLGLPSEIKDIDQFIHHHQPLSDRTPLSAATFWSISQMQFLEEGLEDDSDWSELIDQLDTRLRN